MKIPVTINKFLAWFGVIGLVLVTAIFIAASSYEMQFQQALDDYRAGHYQEAASEFHQLTLADHAHPKMSASIFMWAQSLLKLREYNQALDASAQLLTRFTGSSYVDDAHYLRAEVYLDLDKPMDCGEELIWVVDKGTDTLLVERARNHLRSLSQLVLSERERHSLITHTANSSTQRLILGLAESGATGQGVTIGAVLPLTGPDSDLGGALRQGIEFAFSERKASANAQVLLSFHDSQGNAYEAARIMRDMLEVDRISMVLCAGDEGVATACACQASARQVPCLILNPQTYALSSLGEEIFQLYPDRKSEGVALARYAVQTLGLRTFAVMASATCDGEAMAGGFVQAVKRLGGKVLAQEWFFPGSMNFEKQFLRLRERGLDIMEASTMDTSSVSTQGTLTDSIWANMTNGEVLNVRTENPDESFDTPVNAYDGFFIATDPGDVNILAPQYAFYNFSAQLIGSHDWDNQDSFQKNRNYISGIVYSANVCWDPTSASEQEWINEFRSASGQVPEETQIMGYDGMKWVLQAIDSLSDKGGLLQSEDTLQHGEDFPKMLLQRLEGQKEFQGKGGRYRFQDGINIAVSMVRFDKGKKELLNK